jgi:hypothetical protein
MHRPIQVEVVRRDEGVQPEEVTDAEGQSTWDGSWGVIHHHWDKPWDSQEIEIFIIGY